MRWREIAALYENQVLTIKYSKIAINCCCVFGSLLVILIPLMLHAVSDPVSLSRKEAYMLWLRKDRSLFTTYPVAALGKTSLPLLPSSTIRALSPSKEFHSHTHTQT